MLLVFYTSFFLFSHYIVAADLTVDLGYATFQGTALNNGISQWLGMRYAAPPVGNLRFAAPQDPPEDSTLQLANKHGLICLSTPGNTDPGNPATSEDCLFLDVQAPSNLTADSKLPVYFFIQGGGFNADSNPNLNASSLIAASGFNIVVVTFNYRVGPYGFLSGQEVLAGGSVNNGLKDQRKALQWVQNYISLFGGDPGHVVLGGDSAGAASITLLLTAYGGRNDGLFHASAAESQSFGTVFTVEESQYQYNNLVIHTGCMDSTDTLTCLRSLSAVELQTVNINFPSPGAQQPPLYMYSPVLDYDFVTDYTYAAYAKGNFIKLPAIYGDDTNEGTVFVPPNTNNLSQTSTFIQSQWASISLQQLGTINALYPNPGLTFPNSGPFWRQASNAYGEIRYICPGIFISSVYANLSSGTATTTNYTSSYHLRPRQYPPPPSAGPPIWNYHYNVIDPAQAASGLGVPHTVEINAIWGPTSSSPASYNTTNAAIIPVIQGYWTSFIRSFSPNTYRAAGTPVWEEFTWAGMERLLFETNATRMETVDEGQRGRCEYLWGIAADLRQ